LRFLELLFYEPAEVKIFKGVKIKIPSMSAFLIHKLIVFQRRQNKEKSLKDLKQIVAVAKRIISDVEEKTRLYRLWKTLSDGWKKKVRKGITIGVKELPIEEETWSMLTRILFPA